ncbi:MAG: peptidylprolyl isomerase, partial [Lachnospiraceae bacterium]|nr:peptidylprolyl isomerase [Lachnospiraceae bacterium]
DDNGDEKELSASEKAKKKKQAEEAYAMLEDGTDIETVAEEFGFDPDECAYTAGKTAEEDQDEYYDEAFENAAFSLKEGEYSKVTECADGYYIIQMVTEENEDETAAAMEEAQSAAEDELFTPMLEEMEEKYEITVNEENWDKISMSADIAFKTEEESEEEESTEIIAEEDTSVEEEAE